MTDGIEGALLTPLPEGGTRFLRQARLTTDRGRIGPIEPFSSREPARQLLVPGLIDTHIHLPQLRVRGRFQDALLPWLRESIWPEEARFEAAAYRAEVADEFRTALLCSGTTAAMVWGSPHADSALDVLEGLGPLKSWGGAVAMDRNSPPELMQPTSELLAQARDHAGRWGSRYAVTPRFAPTCTAALMEGLAQIAHESGCMVQTHLAENLDEVAWVAELHPEARSYLDVYDRAGLLGPSTILAHCIHLDDRDLRRIAESGASVAHCPTSNVALGSGRMPIERLRSAGVRVALGTDVGAGPHVSMLDVMRSFLAVHRGRAEVDPSEALRLSTLAGADLLGCPDELGALDPGRRADVVALTIPGGARPDEDGPNILTRILEAYAGRWAEAVAGVWVDGERFMGTVPPR